MIKKIIRKLTLNWFGLIVSQFGVRYRGVWPKSLSFLGVKTLLLLLPH